MIVLFIAAAMSVLGAMIGWFGFRRPVLACLCCVALSAAALAGLWPGGDGPLVVTPAAVAELLVVAALPYLVLFVPTLCAAGVVMGVRRGRARRRRRLYMAGRCPTCGYDLYATPGRCPECGLVPAAPPPPP